MEKIKEVYSKIYFYFNQFKKSLLGEIVFILLAFFIIKTYIGGIYHVPTGSAEPNILVGDRVVGNRMIYKFYRNPERGDYVMFESPNFKFDRSNKLNYFWQKYIGFMDIPLLGLESGPVNVVKRIIAIPGDTVEGRVEDGQTVIYLNGQKLDEPYLNSYPLIGLKKNVGFIPFDSLLVIRTPEILRKHVKHGNYTYVPGVSYEKQPYYNMSADEVIINPYTLKPWLFYPKDPTQNRYGKVVDIFGPRVIPQGKYWVMGDNRKNSEDSRYWGFLDESLVQGTATFILYSIDGEEAFWFLDWIKHPVTFWFKYVRWNRIFKVLR